MTARGAWLCGIAILLAPVQTQGRAGISGAASMRVEVEVYKGPIGQSLEIQIGELSALLAETVKAMNGWREAATKLRRGDPDGLLLDQALASTGDVAASICRIGSYRLETYNYRPLETSGAGFVMPSDACRSYRVNRLNLAGVEGRAIVAPLRQTPEDVHGKSAIESEDTATGVSWLADTHVGAEPTAERITANFEEYNRRVSIVASQMRVAAFRLVDGHIGRVPKNLAVRNAIAGLNLQLMEMANTIATRNANLQKLFDRCKSQTKCDEASKLPTSAYLRDVEPSRFMEAYDWFNADLKSTGTGALKLNDRVRAIKALTEDYYWEKVNEVYASGQGDVNMAFIKDELGNWNLKSYSNDAAKLLAAYRGAFNAALASVVRLASRAPGTPGALVQGNRMLDFANRVATGQGSGTAPTVGGLSLDVLRQRTQERLERATQEFKSREVALFGNGSLEVPADGSALAKLAAAVDAAALPSDQMVARDQLAIAREEARRLPESAAALAQTIIEDYQRDLVMLQEVLSRDAVKGTGTE